MSDTQTLGTNLIAHAPDAIILADCDGVIRLWNRAAEAMFGYGAAEAIGQTLDLIVPEPYRVAHWAGFSRAVCIRQEQEHCDELDEFGRRGDSLEM
jgi:PAS domain S-box-containing protein